MSGPGAEPPFAGGIRRLVSPDQVPPGRPVWIYGSGAAGRLLRDVLLQAGRPVAGFLDSARAGTLDGLPVVPVARFADPGDAPRDAVVLVCSQALEEIAATCRAHGLRDVRDAYMVFLLYRSIGRVLRLP